MSRRTDRLLSRSVAEMRRAAQRGPGLPPNVSLLPVSAAGVPCEWVLPPGLPPARVLLYLHGGGWITGWGNTHRRLLARRAAASAARGLAIDYRLAPEHPFPAALDDCVAAYRWLLRSKVLPHDIVIAGDSAGGQLTITTLLARRAAGDPLPAAAVAISPATDLTSDTGRLEHDDALLSRWAADYMARAYLAGQDPRLPLLSPVYADLAGLPPLLIQVGKAENLRGGALRLAERASAGGVDVTLEVWPEMWHVWHAFAPYLPEARQAIADIGNFARRHVKHSLAAADNPAA